MKNRILYLTSLVIALQMLCNKFANAIAPAAGGELIYQYINDTTYRFYYKYYRACSGIGEPLQVSMCYRNTTCGGIWYTERLDKAVITPDRRPNGQMVDSGGCAGLTNSCTDPNSTNEMYRAWWYTGVVRVQPCNKWIFSVNINARDYTTVTNLSILSLVEHNLYVEATLDNLNFPKQSSPYFTARPPVYACSGSPFTYNGGVLDPDGDSLHYKLIQPRTASADVTVVCAGFPPYNMPFVGGQYNTINNPLETGNTFTLNPVNGDVNFTPIGNQVAFWAYEVQKYRSGLLIGTIMRDGRLEVRTCTTPPIQVITTTGSVIGGTISGDTIKACSNTTLGFCFDATTAVAGTRLMVSDNSDLVMKGATVNYLNQSTANVNGCVIWKPQPFDTGFRYFIVAVKDSTCINGQPPSIQYFKIPVMVKTGTAIHIADTIICPGASTKLRASGAAPYTWSAIQASGFSCTTCDSTIVTPVEPVTEYYVTSGLSNGCATKDTVKIYLDYSTSVNASPDTIVFCDGGGMVQLTAKAFGPGPRKTIACGPYSPAATTGMQMADMSQSSNNSNESAMMYTWVQYWGPFYQYFGTQKMQVILRKDELNAEGMKPGSIQKIALNFAPFTGVNPTFSNVSISMRCTDKNEFVALSHNEFQTGLTQVFSSPSVTIQSGWNEFIFTVPYDFDTSKNLLVQFCYSGVSPQSSNTNNNLPIYYVYTGYRSSIAAGQILPANACANNIGSIVTYNRRPDMRISFTDLPLGNFNYSWTPATGMSNPGADTTYINVSQTKWFTVTTKGKYGCDVKDSVLVYVAEKDFSVYPKDAVICDGEVARFSGSGGYTYRWLNDDFTVPAGFTCLSCDTPNVTRDIGHYPYKVIITDYFGCADTLEATLTVNELPSTQIITNDTTIYFGESIQLEATGAATYRWSPHESLDRFDVANPVASPKKSTLYFLSGYHTSGCLLKDSVWVRVIYSDKVLIPNAFSPNGDGLNDVFKVHYLTFQRILLFSVHDRWGKQVYNAGIGDNGWNGTYDNGAPAATGTYFYFIKILNSDQTISVYKGDVTLLR